MSRPGEQRRVIHRGAKFDLELLEYRGSGGRAVRREIVRHPGAVVILPLLPGGRVVLIRNHRPSLDRPLLELPAGTLEKGEDPRACAARELEEETGYAPATLRPLGRFYTSPGMSDELMHAFAAIDLTQAAQRLEEDERITLEVTPVGVALAMAADGRLEDGKSMLTLLLAQRAGII
jgi:ADP-ribose pyrophosphatase